MSSLNIYSTILVSVVFICVSVLTYAGKISPHVITTLTGLVGGWLLKQGSTTIAEARVARARATPLPEPTPLPDTPREGPTKATTFAEESPTARSRRSDAVTQPMQAFQKPEDKK